ncbi:hypothetical protein C8J57DRAFT_1234764 [Mycena rebaudengoi]|nr:hypothetical protein C8J57DRAFT_1234764 [Mycena rebaudengoi]
MKSGFLVTNPQFTSSPSQISAHCDGNSTSQESGALDHDSDSGGDIDGNAYEDEPPPEAGPSRLKNPTPSTLASRTLEDIWHVKDRLLRILPHGHSAFKPFAVALKLSTFVYDRNDRARVEEVLNKNDETWNDVLRNICLS